MKLRNRPTPEYSKRLDALHATRRAHHVSQFQLADYLGHTSAWFGEIERGQRVVDATLLNQIENALAAIVAARHAVSP